MYLCQSKVFYSNFRVSQSGLVGLHDSLVHLTVDIQVNNNKLETRLPLDLSVRSPTLAAKLVETMAKTGDSDELYLYIGSVDGCVATWGTKSEPFPTRRRGRRGYLQHKSWLRADWVMRSHRELREEKYLCGGRAEEWDFSKFQLLAEYSL